MGRFQKRVLDQAVKEINEFSPLDVTYDTKRTGRKITSINLKFKQKPKQTQIATETPKREQTGQEPIKPLTELQIAKYSMILCKLGSISDLAEQWIIQHLQIGLEIYLEIQKQ